MGRTSELTPRERRLIQGVIAGKSQAQAAREAGYPTELARFKASEVLHRPHVREHYRALLAEAGLDDASLVALIKEGAVAAKQAGLTRDGDVVDMGPDWHARAKFLDMGLKIADAYPNAKLDVNANVTGAVVVLRADDALSGGDPFAAESMIDVTPGEPDEGS